MTDALSASSAEITGPAAAGPAMPPVPAALTLGVEEEFHVVDLETRGTGAAGAGTARPARPAIVLGRAAPLGGGDATPRSAHDARRAPRGLVALRAPGDQRRRPVRARPGRRRYRAAGRPRRTGRHADLTLPADARTTTRCWSASSSSAARRCTSGWPTGTSPWRSPSGSARALPVAARPLGQLAVLDGRGQRVRERAVAGLAALADRRRPGGASPRPPTTTRWSPT